MKKILFLLVIAAGCGYWLLLAKPGLYYNKTLEYRCYTLNARGELPANMEAVLDRAYEKISASDLFNQDIKFSVYLTGSRGEFGFFTPFLKGSYVRMNPFRGYIFLAPADFASDKMAAAPGALESDVLSTGLAAGAARDLARRVVKPLSFLVMSEWKLRGFSERISGGTGAYLPADICKDADPARLDYEYALALDYALRVDGMSITELLNKDYSYEKVESAMRKATCGR